MKSTRLQWCFLCQHHRLAALELPGLCLALLLLAGPLECQESRAAEAINLLSYIAVDYGAAVQGGRVVDEALYRRQRRDIAGALELVRRLPARPGRDTLESRLLSLDIAVANMRPGEEVRRLANGIADRLASLYQLPRSPVEALPAAAEAAPMYATYCASCHGEAGRGSGAAPPLNDLARMGSFSLYDLYNKLDPSVTPSHAAIAAGNGLDSRQRWALAVAVANLAVADIPSPPVEMARRYPNLTGLPGLATVRPVELPDEVASALLWWRGHPRQASALQHPLARAEGLLQVAETTYRAGDSVTAYRRLILAYRQDYLPLRATLTQRDPPLANQLESGWQVLRELILDDAPSAEVIAAFKQLRETLGRAQTRLQVVAPQPPGYWLAALLFFGALSLGLLLWWALRRRSRV
ncbi:c-type cytochrome [Microbulbifer sp. TYP-18]|uniref:c-type cytochrome n=1 Tax=Microbulbifer sp. TYP-18 TaxID=3230024 RepID=UPI0034C684EC